MPKSLDTKQGSLSRCIDESTSGLPCILTSHSTCESLSSGDETEPNTVAQLNYATRPLSCVYGKSPSIIEETSTKRVSSERKRRTILRRRSSSVKSLKSEQASKQIIFGALTRRIKSVSMWLAPLSPIPFGQSGIAWNGVFRRMPILIFSPTALMKKDSSVRLIGQKLNLCCKITKSDCRLLRTLLKTHGFTEVPSIATEYNLLWTNSHIKPTDIKSLHEFQRVNHFPKSYELTRKDRLAHNIKTIQTIKGVRHFDIIPKTYILPSEHTELRSNYLKDHGPYIVKPVASSRGRGIYIVSSPDQVVYSDQVIVSNYVTNPLLIDGFKFDLRLYVAVTSYSPLVIYIYEEGLARFATVRYQKGPKHYKNLCMHLTNYSVNKKNHLFVHNDDADVEDFGNKWSLGAILRYLRSNGKDTAGLMLRIEDVIIKAFISVEEQISQSCRLFLPSKFNCFELYGFDIIIDDNLRPWLLEVNLSPSLACDTPLDFKVKSNMLSDLLNLAGIICFDPTKRNKRSVATFLTSPNYGTLTHPTYFVPAHSYNSRETQEKTSSNIPRQMTSCSTDTPRPLGSANSLSKMQSKISHSAEDITADELRLIRRFQEETARAGGWLRIFPSPESWEQYAGLLHPGVRVGGPSEPPLPPPPQWRLSMSANSSSSVANSVSRSIKTPMDTFSVHVSAAMAISAMQRANILSLKTAFENSDKDVTLIHPNLIPPKVDLALFAGVSESTGSWDEYSKNQADRSVRVQLPALQNNTSLFASIHSLEPRSVNESLMVVIGFEQDEKRHKRADSLRMASCYAQTLSRLPFYFRKLGALPTCVRGVCLLAGCSHGDTGQSRFCGMNTLQETPAKRGNVKVSSLIAPSPCRPATVSLTTINDLAQTCRRKANCRLSEEAIRSLSQLQVRTTFCNYLARIHARLISQVREMWKKGEPFHSRKSDEQADLMLRFLQKAAINLSSEAVTDICTGSDVDQSMFTDGIFKIPPFAPSASILVKQKLLVRLLDIFVRIYTYETTLNCVETDMSAEVGVDYVRFNDFIRNATENELEAVLSQYTRMYHSMSLFVGSISNCGKLEREVPVLSDTISQTNSNKPQQPSWSRSISSMPEQLESVEEQEFILVPQMTTPPTMLKPRSFGRRKRKPAYKNSRNVRKLVETSREGSLTLRQCSRLRFVRYTSPFSSSSTGSKSPAFRPRPHLGRTQHISRRQMEDTVFPERRRNASATNSDGDFEAVYYDPAVSIHNTQAFNSEQCKDFLGYEKDVDLINQSYKYYSDA